jgi:hypothetical protein
MIIVAVMAVGSGERSTPPSTPHDDHAREPAGTEIATRPRPNSFEKTQGRNAPHRLPLGRRRELRPPAESPSRQDSRVGRSQKPCNSRYFAFQGVMLTGCPR